MRWIFFFLTIVAARSVYDYISEKIDKADSDRLADINYQHRLLADKPNDLTDIEERERYFQVIIALENEKSEILSRHPDWIR